MFRHIKDLQFDARVSKPDPRFAQMLLDQFGGGNGELPQRQLTKECKRRSPTKLPRLHIRHELTDL
jgi:hypothetical protein